VTRERAVSPARTVRPGSRPCRLPALPPQRTPLPVQRRGHLGLGRARPWSEQGSPWAADAGHAEPSYRPGALLTAW